MNALLLFLHFMFLIIIFNRLAVVSGSASEEVAGEATLKFVDYYWRDYTGIVPSDAISAGTDKLGKPIYVGQGFFMEVGLLPATVYPGSKTIQVTAWGKVFTTDKDVKILCSQNPQRYRWVPTKVQDMHLLTNCHLVVGGTETEAILNIGRATQDMELQVGKIFPDFSPYKGLALAHKGKEANYKSFEVLTYNCSTKHLCDNLELQQL